MKKIILFVLLAAFSVPTFAQHSSFFFSDESDPTQFKEVDGGIGLLCFTRLYEKDGGTIIQMDVHNIRNDELLVVFNNSYDKKALKKMNPCFYLDKTRLPGINEVLPCEEADKDFIIISSEEQEKVHQFIMKDGDKQKGTLPIYIAKYKNSKKTKVTLLDVKILDYEVSFEEKEDADYHRLSSECDKLETELANATVKNCKITPRKGKRSPKPHYGSIESQRDAYKQRVERLKNEINTVMSSHKWNKESKNYKLYSKLLTKLDAIKTDDIKVVDCEKCSTASQQVSITPQNNNQSSWQNVQPEVPKCSCGHCTMSLSSIYSTLDGYLKKIDNGKATKASVLGSAQSLYSSCTSCKVRKESFSGAIKSKIVNTYNRIVSH